MGLTGLIAHSIDNDLYEGALDVLERLHERFVVGTRLHLYAAVWNIRHRAGVRRRVTLDFRTATSWLSSSGAGAEMT